MLVKRTLNKFKVVFLEIVRSEAGETSWNNRAAKMTKTVFRGLTGFSFSFWNLANPVVWSPFRTMFLVARVEPHFSTPPAHNTQPTDRPTDRFLISDAADQRCAASSSYALTLWIYRPSHFWCIWGGGPHILRNARSLLQPLVMSHPAAASAIPCSDKAARHFEIDQNCTLSSSANNLQAAASHA
jgi:hypothetical protein